MDTSFDLLCSMSPKFTKFVKPTKKLPSKLALKKHIRRSSILSVNSKKPDESIISISSATTSSDGSSDKAVVISASDSNKSIDKATPELSSREHSSSYYRLTKQKYGDIKSWLNTVEIAQRVNSILKSPSVISENENAPQRPKKTIAFNSTFLPNSSSKRFDELFDKYDGAIEDQFGKMTIIDDSLDLIKDSFEKKSIDEEKSKQNCDNAAYGDIENVLDEIYGKSWRQKKEDILPKSEPRVKKKNETNGIFRNPVTEKPRRRFANDNYQAAYEVKTFNNVRKKPVESPWAKILNNLCDKETDSEEENLLQTRLNFDEPDENQVKLKPTTRPIKTDVKSKIQLGNQLLLPSKVTVGNGKKSGKSTNDKGTKVVPNVSFLASLSGSVPVARCDVTALIYRTNFKQHKVDLGRKLFDLFNDKVFNSSIPKNTVLKWNDKMRRSAGFCRCKKKISSTAIIERYVQIDLSTKVVDSADRLRDTLIHEMCHAATWIVNKVSDGHGEFWRAWSNQALEVFPELPPIRTCHSYVINTKYTYRCVGCGYCVGRHTKSLDIDRKCCGYCRGRFEILINKTTKNGETKTVPATPKKTTGFALFVKENYANFRTPDLKHAAVMKLLGQKFSEMKT